MCRWFWKLCLFELFRYLLPLCLIFVTEVGTKRKTRLLLALCANLEHLLWQYDASLFIYGLFNGTVGILTINC
jgi:hypothetical protein